jgi:hypothetical protein
MAVRVLPEARDDLREAVRYYRGIKLPAVGKQFAGRVLASFKRAVASVALRPLSRPVHGKDRVVVSVEYATRDYVDRVNRRAGAAGTKWAWTFEEGPAPRHP